MSEHPTFKTEEEIAAMKAADPAAFDLDDGAPEETDEAEEARERDENGRFKAKDAKPETVDESTKPDEVAEAEDGKVDEAKPADKPEETKSEGIPKPRFDEVIAERNRERDARLAAERELADLRAQQAASQAKDFDAEIQALDQKYDDGDIEFVDYQKQMRTLVAEKTRAEVLAEVDTKRKKEAEETVQQTWEQAQHKFFAEDGNDKYRSKPALIGALRGAVEQVWSEGPVTDYYEALNKAKALVDAEFGKPANDKPEEKPDPHAKRKAADAAAASLASSTPPAINGGVGGRGTTEAAIDLKNMRPGKFSSLPKDVQERLLGEGAL